MCSDDLPAFKVDEAFFMSIKLKSKLSAGEFANRVSEVMQMCDLDYVEAINIVREFEHSFFTSDQEARKWFRYLVTYAKERAKNGNR